MESQGSSLSHDSPALSDPMVGSLVSYSDLFWWLDLYISRHCVLDAAPAAARLVRCWILVLRSDLCFVDRAIVTGSTMRFALVPSMFPTLLSTPKVHWSCLVVFHYVQSQSTGIMSNFSLVQPSG